MNRITRTRLAAATAAVAALSGAALLAPGAANAAPVSQTAPVPGTQCNVGQVERATAKVAPEFWRHVSGDAKAKDRFEQMLVKTPEQRKTAREAAKKEREARHGEWRKTHPGQAKPARPMPREGKAKPTKAQVEQKIATIKATCATS